MYVFMLVAYADVEVCVCVFVCVHRLCVTTQSTYRVTDPVH